MADFFYGTGRRKTSVARVFLKPGKGNVVVNGKALDIYFERPILRQLLMQPLVKVDGVNKFDLYITVKGGGKTGQAGAVLHGLARALVSYNAEYRLLIKKDGFLTRDSRMVERKKPGHPKARKSSQFSKR